MCVRDAVMSHSRVGQLNHETPKDLVGGVANSAVGITANN